MVKVQRGEVVRRERLAREMEVEFSDIDPEHLDLALQSSQNPAAQVRRAGSQEPV
jgi:histidinol dehydrogenase